jgi:hypothetical protein
MIEHWLKTSLQSTYQDARYAGARTRYGLAATRARPRTTRRGGEQDDDHGAEAVTMPSPAEATAWLPGIDAAPLRGTPTDPPADGLSIAATIAQSLY